MRKRQCPRGRWAWNRLPRAGAQGALGHLSDIGFEQCCVGSGVDLDDPVGSFQLGIFCNSLMILSVCLSVKSRGQEGEGSRALQSANEEVRRPLCVELNVLKGPSRGDYSK